MPCFGTRDPACDNKLRTIYSNSLLSPMHPCDKPSLPHYRLLGCLPGDLPSAPQIKTQSRGWVGRGRSETDRRGFSLQPDRTGANTSVASRSKGTLERIRRETLASWNQPLKWSNRFGQPRVLIEQLVSFQLGFAVFQGYNQANRELANQGFIQCAREQPSLHLS